jgi:hypothetical protein
MWKVNSHNTILRDEVVKILGVILSQKEKLR